MLRDFYFVLWEVKLELLFFWVCCEIGFAVRFRYSARQEHGQETCPRFSLVLPCCTPASHAQPPGNRPATAPGASAARERDNPLPPRAQSMTAVRLVDPV